MLAEATGCSIKVLDLPIVQSRHSLRERTINRSIAQIRRRCAKLTRRYCKLLFHNHASITRVK